MEPKLSLYYEAGETKLLIAMQGKKTFLGFAIVQLDSIGAG